MVKTALLALMWGCISAVSLPLGALIGLWTKPSKKITSAMMAFGGGALLFALTIELFAHSLHRSHQGHDFWIILGTMIGAASGGLLFEFLNQILSERGAFLRHRTLIKKHIQRFKYHRARQMIQALSKVQILNVLPPDEIVHLIPHVKTERFPAGTNVVRQGDAAQKLYFIASGRVRVFRESGQTQALLAELGEGDVFGEIALLTDQTRTGTVQAKTDVELWSIDKSEFEHLLRHSPALQEASRSIVISRLQDIQTKDKASTEEADIWERAALKKLGRVSIPITELDMEREVKAHTGGGAALAIWLGIALDGIPESLVIGMLVVAAAAAGTKMSIAFIAGVFLANLPEAMSSAVTMQRQGSRFGKIFWMWMSLCFMTGIGAFLGAVIFPDDPHGGLRYIISGIEGLAAGAMLTMIAETMLPEAFEQGGGAITGLSTLAGFLAAVSVKLLSMY
ncbi:MAG: cyclic nucleotide-binding domain-containing protein [Deltaproteobacteria bacterium]|nr:cyclic nucleotide-binding domain-containing protein [Deltaproteobacteria bacterium]